MGSNVHETEASYVSGWVALPLWLAGFGWALWQIASAMLRRQQAEAVVAARGRILEGAIGMVRMAVEQLEGQRIVALTDADRVKLVTNLMTVLVSDSEAQPVLPVGRDS